MDELDTLVVYYWPNGTWCYEDELEYELDPTSGHTKLDVSIGCDDVGELVRSVNNGVSNG